MQIHTVLVIKSGIATVEWDHNAHEGFCLPVYRLEKQAWRWHELCVSKEI